jgi:voltage-gated potassium channel
MRFFRRAYERFQANPSSARYATAVIVSVTVVVVLVGALLMRLLDHEQYESFGEAVWFTLQTVTTVGYGDSTPTSTVGRVVAGVVMLTGIGLITVVTAGVTSVFIEAARVRAARFNAEAEAKDPHPLERVEARLAEIAQRLERLEAGRSVDGEGSDQS